MKFHFYVCKGLNLNITIDLNIKYLRSLRLSYSPGPWPIRTLDKEDKSLLSK